MLLLPRSPHARRALGWLGLTAAGANACSETPAGPPTPPPPQTVRVSYCSGLEPTWVAFQDGDGPWTNATPASDGSTITFQYVFHANRGGIATLTALGAGMTALGVLYGAPAELATAGDTKAIYCGDPVSKTILGTVLGLDTNERAVVSGHLSRSVANPAVGGGFALNGLGAGPHDLIATRETRANGGTAVTSVIVRRDVALADSATAPPFDFASSEASPPAAATLTLVNTAHEDVSVAVRLITGTTEALISPVRSPSPDVVRPYAALPAGGLQAGDLQEIFASAVDGPASRGAEVYFRSPRDGVLALPAPVIRPTFDTIASAPVLRLRAWLAPQQDYDRLATITYQQDGAVLVGVSMTAAYAALTGGGYDLVVPDLSAAAGFNPAWGLHAGDWIRWTATRIGGTVRLGVDAQPVDGSTRRVAIDSDTIPRP